MKYTYPLVKYPVHHHLLSDIVEHANRSNETHSNSTIPDRKTRNKEGVDYFKELPIKDVYYKFSGNNSDRSVFLVPRTAYFDRRLVDGKSRNRILVISEVHDLALYAISACELNGRHISNSIHLIYETSFTKWVRRTFRKMSSYYSHRIAVIECEYLPELITNGSIVKILYKKSSNHMFYNRVETEMPLLVTNLGVNPSRPTQGLGSVVACSTVYGHPEAEGLDNWLRYQRTLGVDLVHLDVDVTFYEGVNLSKVYPFLGESMRKGFVQIDYWNNVVGTRMYNRGQMLKYQNCIYRYMGMFDFGMFSDIDDFFNPMIPQHRHIHYYLNDAFSNKTVGTACLNWKTFPCQYRSKEHLEIPGGNVTAVISTEGSYWRTEPKCAHRLNATLLVYVHSVHTSLPGYSHSYINQSFAYVAHNRFSGKAC